MKKILLVSLSILFANQMEVDGDLNVSGDIHSPTITQLQEIIAQLQGEITVLQAQINSMQDTENKFETKFFHTETITDGDYIDIYNDLNEPISELDFYLLEIVQVNDFEGTMNGGNGARIILTSTIHEKQMVNVLYDNDYFEYYSPFYPGGEPYKGLFTDSNLEVSINGVNTASCKLLLAITAQFPTDSAINSKNSKDSK